MNSYKTSNVCAKEVSFEIIDNKISSVNFEGGCNDGKQHKVNQ